MKAHRKKEIKMEERINKNKEKNRKKG